MFINPLDQSFFAVKMPVDNRVGYPHPLGQFAGLAFESTFGKEAHCFSDNLLFPVFCPHVFAACAGGGLLGLGYGRHCVLC